MKSPTLKKASAFVLVLFFIGLASCANKQISETMASWVGHSSTELISAWGLPKHLKPDENGGKILVYEYDRQYTVKGLIHQIPFSNSYYLEPDHTEHYVATREFYVDSNGIITRWAWQGE
ncbi:MAG: hypothetical protein KQJ78_05775 [Deltaproteobacteria bacterium]|nr:hypothetical protein [Deltaproteobacteria bacterium]